jgi:hypothetical protein
MLAAALRYALDLGRPVLPLVPRDKRPIVARGLRAATTHEETVRAWWTRTPDANIGLLCGFGLLCLDVDGPAGAKSLRQLVKEHGPLPETVESITPRGRHISFGYDETTKIRPSAGRLGEGLDVRADGSYVVAPPSVHPSGRRYRWRRGHEPGEHVLADAPAWLLELIGRATTHAVPRSGRPGEQHASPPPTTTRDRSASGKDWHRCLEMMRGGASDEDVAVELRRRSAKYATRGESYIKATVERARDTHDASTPRAAVRSARLDHWPERPGKPAMTRVRLSLVTADGEVISAGVVVPTKGYESTADLWRACFPDVDPGVVAGEWRSVARRLKGRRFHVATRGGSVTWIRAADTPAKASARGAARGGR